MVKAQIDYSYFCDEKYGNRSVICQVDEIVATVTDVLLSPTDHFVIEGIKKPADLVKARLTKLTRGHIEEVIKSLSRNPSPVRNMRKYLLSCLFNITYTYHNQKQNRTQSSIHSDAPTRKRSLTVAPRKTLSDKPKLFLTKK